MRKKIKQLEEEFGQEDKIGEIKVSKMIDMEHNVYTLNMSDLFDIISHKKYVYVQMYRREPIYIKIPLWTYECIRMEARNLVGYSINNNIEELMGMRIIPTPTIESINEIELL